MRDVHDGADTQRLLGRRGVLQEQLELNRERLSWQQRRRRARPQRAIAVTGPCWHYSEGEEEAETEGKGSVIFSPNGRHLIDPHGRGFVLQDGQWRPFSQSPAHSGVVAVTNQGGLVCRSPAGGFCLEGGESASTFATFHLIDDSIATFGDRLISVVGLSSGGERRFRWPTAIDRLLFSHTGDHLIVQCGRTLASLHLASSQTTEQIYGPLGDDQSCLTAQRLRSRSGDHQATWWLLLYSPRERMVSALVCKGGQVMSRHTVSNVALAALSHTHLISVDTSGSLMSCALPGLDQSRVLTRLAAVPVQLVVPSTMSGFVALRFREEGWKFIILT